MICVDLSNMRQFIPLPYEAALTPRLRLAHEKLLSGTGAGGDFTGWVHLPEQYDREEFRRIQAAAKKIQSDSQALVVIGIGGSYLGARGVIECLCSPNYNLKKKNTPNIYFVGNGLDNDQLAEVEELLEGQDFSVNVISKSGTTTEPAVAFRFFRRLLEKKYGAEAAAGRIYATTDRQKGALKALAAAEGYESFVVPDDIGGRYSVLTAVGLLPIAVAGIDIEQLMAGAKSMMDTCAAADMEKNPAWQYAGARYELQHRGLEIEVLACFDPFFRFMAEWWKQLFGESEGKNGIGIFPASVEYTADLHSMGQYIQDGPRAMMETVVRFKRSHNSYAVPFEEADADGLNYLAGRDLTDISATVAEAVKEAHISGGVPNMIIEVDRRDEEGFASLVCFFEMACAISGYMSGVNPFNQPGVEAYKKNMFRMLGKPGC